jgi:hypothetical protein
MLGREAVFDEVGGRTGSRGHEAVGPRPTSNRKQFRDPYSSRLRSPAGV